MNLKRVRQISEREIGIWNMAITNRVFHLKKLEYFRRKLKMKKVRGVVFIYFSLSSFVVGA